MLFGIVASFVALAAWLAVLIVPGGCREPARLPRAVRPLHDHLAAYLSFAASPYPRFRGPQPLPRRRRGRPARRPRAARRALPARPRDARLVRRVVARRVGGARALVRLRRADDPRRPDVDVAVLAWFACLAVGGCRAGCATRRRTAAATGRRSTAYALMVTARYPDSAPDRLADDAELPPHPVAVDLRDDLGRPRAPRPLPAPPLRAPPPLADALGRVVTAAVLLALAGRARPGRLPRVLHRFMAAFVRTRRTSWRSSTSSAARSRASSAARAATRST